MIDIATPDDIGEIADVWTDAFRDDPLFAWMFPDSDGSTGRRARMALITAQRGLAHGHTYVHRSAEGIVAAASWSPPGKEFYTRDDGSRLADLIIGADPDRATEIFAGTSEMHAYAPSQPHFLLQMIGVRQSARGTGIGGALLASTLKWIDQLHALTYLESSNSLNVSLYERAGFEVIKEVTMPEGGPVVRPMVRAATQTEPPWSEGHL